MLPRHQLNAYRLYKHLTKRITDWLVPTAKAHGYPGDLGYAKEDKKGSIPTNRIRGWTYSISTQDYIRLAEWIAEAQIPVPSWIDLALGDLIESRKEFSREYARHQAEKDVLADQKHAHFVQVLEIIRQILRPLVQTPSESAVESAATGNTPCERPEQVTNNATIHKTESSGTQDDVVRTAMAGIAVLSTFRDTIIRIWLDYQKDKIGLAAAAISTNTAIEAARQEMDKFVPEMETNGGIFRIMSQIFDKQASAIACGEKHLGPSGVDFLHCPYCGDGLYELGRESFYFVTRELFSMVERFKEKASFMGTEDEYHQYFARSDRPTKTAYEKHKKDRAIMAVVLDDLFHVTRLQNYPVKDEMIRGMIALSETGQIPFYLIFAIQIHLDIHDFLGEGVIWAFQTLQVHATNIQGDLKAQLQLHQEGGMNHEIPSKEVRAQMDMIDMVLTDPVYEFKTQTLRDRGMEIPQTIERNRILEMSPVLSGLILFRIRLEYRRASLVGHSFGAIASAIHLHNALQSEKLFTAEWQDMDVARKILGDSVVFDGDAPIDPSHYLRKFEAQFGRKAQNLAGSNSVESRKCMREIKLENQLPVSSKFVDRYVNLTEQSLLTIDSAEIILGFGNHGIAQYTPTERGTGARTRGQVFARGKKLREPLIYQIAVSLTNEWDEIAYPWMRLYCSSWDFLKWVHERCHVDLRDRFGPGFTAHMEKESGFIYMNRYIFAALVDGNQEVRRHVADGTLDFYSRSQDHLFMQQDGCFGPPNRYI
ncbi:hypothetical protein PFICI_14769 [Pestalotiopsis fici W106-1]|uniref:DUF6604 domain-containing protein n=1 Tax=Pestalotiopsis fici (strain W106-1 / CGMCC3.15140) TaxID=1229662 RepID=W3WIX0_PESFW|nr:uncharacterized protein PFICI_14769 [Pestalotiopsis fici W106-1]ETS73823.1 hypothetical protein PFICI_14769 [Pestalotiopsis fici W106-1]